MNFTEVLLKKIQESKLKLFAIDDVYKLLGFKAGFDKRAVEAAMRELVRQDKLVFTKRGKFCLPDYSGAMKAVIMMTRGDNAFARPVSGGADVFVPERNLNGACQGDTVLVKVNRRTSKNKIKAKTNSNRNSFRAEEAEVIKILERGATKVVGLFVNENGSNLVIPDDTRFADSIFIQASDTLGAQHEFKVVVEITEYPSRIKMAQGRVIEVLGKAGSYKVSTLSIIRSFGLIEEFPEIVEKAAKELNVPVSEEDLKNRKDYRNMTVVTIDGEDARDFDDAITVEKRGEGFKLYVHIADVSHYVRENSVIDKEAFRRGTSVYFPDYVLPMLPVALSNGICSLNPNEDRLTLSVEMDFDSMGNIKNHSIQKGVIRSSRRMTYTSVQKMIDGDQNEIQKFPLEWKMLSSAVELAKLLLIRRDKAGELDFDLPEPKIVVDSEGKVVEIVKKPRGLADRLIEQFMVVTNEVVASHFSKMDVPFVYRVHEEPTMERIRSFKSFASGLGLVLHDSNGATPKEFQRILKSAKNQPYFTAVSKIMLRSMQKAKYAPENLGHFGLALKDYCHFTSPIRRYPDLFIHRMISYILEGKLGNSSINILASKADEASLQSSVTERNADEAERTVDDQKKAEFMADKIGEEYDGIVSGVNEAGLFVELENTVEGFIYKEYLPKDIYTYDESKFLLAGRRQIFRIGDAIRVKLAKVDVITRHIDFVLAENAQNSAKSGKNTVK
ncbi:MAG: ribonuclease R [Clostridia bacterium]|nr:ribonuclease R [Clostridia bacterium]